MRWFAFIRAINTGNRRLTNPEQIQPFIDLGFDDVAAYQAAGNITFVTDDSGSVSSEAIESALADAYGFEAPVFLRSQAELEAVAASQPFTESEIAATEGRTQVSFMSEKPSAAVVDEVQAMVPAQDRVVFDGREWFWLPVAGVSTSDLPVPAIERLVGPMTMRTMGTVTRMLNKFA